MESFGSMTDRPSPPPGSIPVPEFDTDLDYSAIPPRSRSCSVGFPAFQLTDKEIMDVYPEDLKNMIRDPTYCDGKILKILDCRFRYEFRGGHVVTAINVNRKEDLINFYNEFKDQNVIVVFHCEYSQERGPNFMQMFREHDRAVHEGRYPQLAFPHVGLLRGGFKAFYTQYPEECIGQYIPMRSKTHVQNGELRRCYSDYSNEMNTQRRMKMERAAGPRSPVSCVKLEPIAFTFDVKPIPMIPLKIHVPLSQSLWK